MIAFPDPSGPYKVGQCDCLLRQNEDGSGRKLVVRLFYPVDAEDWQNGRQATWLPSTYNSGAISYAQAYAKALWFPGISSALIGSLGFQPLMSTVRTPTKEDVPLSSHASEFDPVIFSHGLAASRSCHSATCMDLASHGRLVVAVEFSDGSAAVNILPDKTVNQFLHAPRRHEIPAKQKRIPGGFAASLSPQNEAKPVSQYEFRNSQLHRRVKEVRFVADCLEHLNAGTEGSRIELPEKLRGQLKGRLAMSRLSSVGHSFGACTNITLCQEDPRFRATVCHDVWLFPSDSHMAQASLACPTLFLSADTFDNLWPDEGRRMVDGLLLRSRRDGLDAQDVHVRGTRHQNYSDFPVLAPQLTVAFGASGPTDPRRSMETINTCTRSFLDHHLHSHPSAPSQAASWFGRALQAVGMARGADREPAAAAGVAHAWHVPEALGGEVAMQVLDEERKALASEQVRVGLFTYDAKIKAKARLGGEGELEERGSPRPASVGSGGEHAESAGAGAGAAGAKERAAASESSMLSGVHTAPAALLLGKVSIA